MEKDNELINKFLEYLDERFGIKREIFYDYDFIISGTQIRIFSKSIYNKDLDGIHIKGIGLKAAMHFEEKDGRIKFKPSTVFIQIFGRYATKNIIDVNENEAMEYISGGDIKHYYGVERGYVIIRWNKKIVGVGLYNEGTIKNQIPKKKRIIKPNPYDFKEQR